MLFTHNKFVSSGKVRDVHKYTNTECDDYNGRMRPEGSEYLLYSLKKKKNIYTRRTYTKNVFTCIVHKMEEKQVDILRKL